MALSFSDSLKSQQIENEAAAVALTASVMADEPSVMSLDDSDYGIATLSYGGDGGENWQWDSKYERYTGEDGVAFSMGYDDSDISSINDVKNVTLNPKQMNINQEHKSQFIPFEMPRYYDGYDLMNATICVNYRRSDGDIRTKKAVNVRYSKDKIQFGWLVEAHATEVVGKLEFEIVAFGSDYIWKSRMVNSMNVIESIPFSSELVSISSDETWISEIVEAVAGEIVGMEFSEQLTQANAAAEKAETAATKAEQSAASASTAAEEKVNEVLGDYAKKSYVDAAVAAIDVTDQLADYVTNENLSANYYTKTDSDAKLAASLENYATKDDVSDAISSADLDSYYKKTETYSQIEIDDKLANVSVDLSGYATETYVNNKVAPISSSVETNKSDIATLSATVGTLQSAVDSIDKSPRLTYDAVYNDLEDPNSGENKFVLYEIENEGVEGFEVKTPKASFVITGGSGGGTSSTLKIGYVTTSPLVVTTNDDAIIKYTFSGTDSSGDIVPEGVATWKVGGRVVATNTAVAGENSFDITDYVSIGTQKVLLTITDDAGSLATKTWTVQKIDVKIESDFNDKLTYPMGTVSFGYTPYGAVSKTVHFVLDGTEIGTVVTSSSGLPMAYEIPTQEHGAHLLEVYMTAEINGNMITSNRIVKDIIWYDTSSTVPVISTVYQKFTARQYDATNIEYTVYDPTTETPSVQIAVDGDVVSTPVLEDATNIYAYKTDAVGDHTITITCRETVKTLKATITKLDIDVSPVVAGLAFDFNPSGKSNNDADRLWTNGTVSMSVSENFDWGNGGYQYDENGDQYFCIKAGTSAEINYQLFADDAKKNGKEMKLVFKTVNVAKPDATFLKCLDNTTDSDHIGIQMDVHEANIYGQANNLNLPYSEEDVIEFEFNISKNTEAIPMVMGYEDGVSTRPMVYDDSYNFTQNTPKTISLGSNDCDLHIYRFKVYNTSLTDIGILNNFIADARNAEEMVNRYDRNQIYDENSQLDPDILAEKCPWLRVYKVSAPYFTNNKSDKVPNTTIQQIYKGGDPTLDNWTCYDCQHSGQGTSSNNYGAAGRNLDFIMNKSGLEDVKPRFVMGDGSEATKITLTRTSVPTNYLNAKVNIASSNNMTNAMLANRYNEFNPYKRSFIRDENVDTSFIKDTMEFHNCVIFIQETNEDLSTHREFADTNWHKIA